MGLTYDDLKGVKPDIICTHISAYGGITTVLLAGYDYLMQAECGFIGDRRAGHPSRFGLSMIDFMTGVVAALGCVSHCWRDPTADETWISACSTWRCIS